MKRAVAGMLIIITVLSGCADKKEAGTNNGKEGEGQTISIELNERQKAILEKEGKPLVYSELDTLSKDAIFKIEGCYEHLDETYPDVEFEYVTYYYTNPMHLVVYTKDDALQRPVCVYIDYKNGEYTYTDTYMSSVVDSDKYAEEVRKYVNDIYPEAGIFVKTELSNSDYKSGDGYIMERASGTTSIIMSDVFSGKDEAKELLMKVIDWMGSYNDTSELVYLYVLTDEDFKEATIENYIEDFIKPGKAVYRITVSKDVDGEVRFLGKD